LKKLNVFFVFFIAVSSVFGQATLPKNQCGEDQLRPLMDKANVAIQVRDLRNLCSILQELISRGESCKGQLPSDVQNQLLSQNAYQTARNVCRCAQTNDCQ